jgi:hypothetical protein
MTDSNPFAVNQFGSHPDLGNDDCQSGAEFDSLSDAEAAFSAPVTDPYVAFVELLGPSGLRKVRANPAYDAAFVARERAPDDAEWRQERAMQAGMGLGIDAYNEAMGYEIEDYNEAMGHE